MAAGAGCATVLLLGTCAEQPISSSSSNSRRHATPAQRTVLLACFFVLGMGLLAPISAILQCLDSLNAQYEGYYPAKALPTCYNLTYLLSGVALFCCGARVWPGRRSRMLTGYLLFVVALVVPPLLDLLLLDLAAGSVRWGQSAGMAAWALGAAAAGAADAAISSVGYGEAAAIGLRFTHGFLAGKATSGLVVVLLRCMAKGVVAPDASLPGLRRATNVFTAAAAALALLCAAIVAFVLPRLDGAIQLLKAHPGLTVQETLQQCAAPAKQQPPSLTSAADGSGAAPSSPESDASVGRAPDAACIVEVPRSQQRCSKELSSQQVVQHWWSGHQDCSTSADTAAAGVEHSKPPGGCSGCQGRNCSCMQHVQPQQAQVQHHADAPAAGSKRGCHAGSPQLPVVLVHACSSGSSSSSSGSDDGSPVSYGSSGDSVRNELITSQPPSCNTLPRPPPPQGQPMKQQQLPRSRRSLELFASSPGGLQREGMQLHTSTWLAVRLVWPFAAAAFIPPLVTAAILPLILSPQVRQSSVLGGWTIQLTVLAAQLGNVTGAGLLPIPQRLRRPRVVLLGAAAAMLSFIGVFVAVLELQGGPAVIIPLAFVMYALSGYLTSCVFCIAPSGLLSADAELVQQVLVLSTAVSFLVGSGVSWAWLAYDQG